MVEPKPRLFPSWLERVLVVLIVASLLGALHTWHRVGLMEARQLSFRDALAAKMEAIEARFDLKLQAMKQELLAAIEHHKSTKEDR